MECINIMLMMLAIQGHICSNISSSVNCMISVHIILQTWRLKIQWFTFNSFSNLSGRENWFCSEFEEKKNIKISIDVTLNVRMYKNNVSSEIN